MEMESYVSLGVTMFYSLSLHKNTGRTRLIEAYFQIEAPDPYPPNKWRTELGTLVVLSSVSSVTYIYVLDTKKQNVRANMYSLGALKMFVR